MLNIIGVGGQHHRDLRGNVVGVGARHRRIIPGGPITAS
jgi:hypothetical protein